MTTTITGSMLFVHTDNINETLNITQIRRKEKDISLPVTPTVEQVNKLGYNLVQATPKPSGDVVTLGPVVVEEGVYKQTWKTRSYNAEELAQRLEEAKQVALSKINKYFTSSLRVGIEYTFNEGVRHIQIRDGDRANLATLRIEADTAIKNEDTEFVRHFRSYEDTIHQLTAEEIVDMTNAATVGYRSLLTEVWELKDLIRLAETIEDIPLIPNAPNVSKT